MPLAWVVMYPMFVIRLFLGVQNHCQLLRSDGGVLHVTVLSKVPVSCLCLTGHLDQLLLSLGLQYNVSRVARRLKLSRNDGQLSVPL
jgi:hypothetical protein